MVPARRVRRRGRRRLSLPRYAVSGRRTRWLVAARSLTLSAPRPVAVIRIVAAVILRHRVGGGRLVAAEDALLAGMNEQRLAQELGADFDDAVEDVDGGAAGAIGVDVGLGAPDGEQR